MIFLTIIGRNERFVPRAKDEGLMLETSPLLPYLFVVEI